LGYNNFGDDEMEGDERGEEVIHWEDVFCIIGMN